MDNINGTKASTAGVESDRSADITERKRNEDALRKRNQELHLLQADFEDLLVGTIMALSNALDVKSKWISGHSKRVTKYTPAIGKEIGLDAGSLRNLEIAALLHDSGKIETYADLLDKKKSLTVEEMNLVRRHPLRGAEILSPLRQLKSIIPAIEHHHVRYDGSGYPDGLKGGRTYHDMQGFLRLLILLMQCHRTGLTGTACKRVKSSLR